MRRRVCCYIGSISWYQKRWRYMFYTLCVCVWVTIESLRPGDMTYASLWWELLLCLMQNESQEEENSALKGRKEQKNIDTHRAEQSRERQRVKKKSDDSNTDSLERWTRRLVFSLLFLLNIHRDKRVRQAVYTLSHVVCGPKAAAPTLILLYGSYFFFSSCRVLVTKHVIGNYRELYI